MAQKTRKYTIITIITAFALSTVIVLVSMAYSVREQRAEAHRQELEKNTVETQTEIGYTLKEYEGEIAVFRGSSSTPYKRLGVPVMLMTDYDRQQLETGIFVQTEAELRSLIEDFTS